MLSLTAGHGTSGATIGNLRGAMTVGQTADQTYRAIGRFISEFSQVEYTIRHYLAEELNLKEEHFTPVVESYDVGMLVNVTKEVFKKSVAAERSARINKLLKRFLELNEDRKRVAHGLWVASIEGGTVSYVPRNKLTSAQFRDQAALLEKRADELCHLRAELTNAFQWMSGPHRRGRRH
jgi:hypothetical protein